VWEWVEDHHGTYAGEPQALRGGSWYDAQDVVGVASHHSSDPNSRYDLFGFRVACVFPIP